MKILLIVVTTIGMLGLVAGAVLAQSGNELFQQALVKERTEGNIAEAIKIYQAIIAKYSTDRNLVATALLQMGLGYEKLGSKAEARKAFDRIVREYKEHRAATEATAHLDELDGDRSAPQFGTIRGRVTERGQPYPTQVFALKAVYKDGQRLRAPLLSTRTNDRGEYELSALRPGQYYVAAAVLAAATDGGVNIGLHVPMFFPDSPDPKRAQVVEVRPGTAISNVDIVAPPVPLRRVRGIVTGIRPLSGSIDIPGGNPVTVTIMMENEWPPALLNLPATTRVDRNGLFEFPGVPPGSYVLSASQEFGNGGHVAIEVRDRDIEVNIAMVPGLTVSGRIVIEPQTAAAPYPAVGVGFRVMLRRDPPLLGSILYASRLSGGTFKFGSADSRPVQTGAYTGGLQPGESTPLQSGDYRVSVEPILAPPTAPEGLAPVIPLGLSRPSQSMEGTYIKSIRLGEADVLNDGLHLHEQPQQELVIVVGANPGTLEGRVVNTRKQPVPLATVVLIPEGGIRFRVDHKLTAADASGRFRLQQIPPGDYKVFAWQDVENGAWQDPDFVRPYESTGMRIRIKEGERVNVEVVGIPRKP